MDFREIRLPEVVIAELFKNSLVSAVNEADERVIELRPAALQVGASGNNPILIAVNYPGSKALPAEHYSFLGTVLNACQVNIKDATIVNTANQPVDFRGLTLFKPKLMLLFNIDVSVLQLNPEPFSVTNIEDFLVLCAPDLGIFTSSSAESRSLKTKLWTALKEIFKL